MDEETKTDYAKSVIDECSIVFYHETFHLLPDHIKKKVSVDIMRHIFNVMVLPTIKKARELDRDYHNKQ